MEQAKIEPPRPLPSIGLSHLPVRKRFELHSRFNIDLYGRYRTKPREASEIRRVTDAWNTPARLYPFLLFDMCTRRRRIPSILKRTHDIPTMKDPRLPVFTLTFITIGEWRVILTLIPIRPFYQTSAVCACVGPPHSPPCLQAMSIYTSEIWYRDSAGGGECRRRPSAHASACWLHDHIRKVTLSHKKNQDVGDHSGRGA